ncbi:hypothetical protein H920_10039 [Fukomys damarensis]|uniref:Uncharacterized protein n=1 Tax=Fukomys damarensis TaxID=885580 RepID=A0A091E0F9_FUKDA|nr:hypothetical protein H920_10039 [Fukomys damarensis]
MKAAAVPRDCEVPNSSHKEDSNVHMRKTIRSSELLLENQQAKISPSSSLFMAVGNNLQVAPPHPDLTDSVQLGVASCPFISPPQQ